MTLPTIINTFSVNDIPNELIWNSLPKPNLLKGGNCPIIPKHIIDEIFKSLSEADFNNAKKLVSENWHVASYLFFQRAIQGNKRCIKVFEDYDNYLSLPKKEKEAIEELQKSSNSEFVKTLFKINCIPEENKSEVKAEIVRLYKISADLGCAKSQFFLAYFNEIPKGNHQNTVKYLTQAADGGLLIAQLILAVIYENPELEEHDIEKAIKYYKEAEKQGSVPAMYALGLIYKKLNSFNEASHYLKLAADGGDPRAQTMLGAHYYEGGDLCEKDRELSLHYLGLAAEEGDRLAMYLLGSSYMKEGVPNAYETGIQFLERSAGKGDVGALHKMCLIYTKGIGVKINLEKAAEYFQFLESFLMKREEKGEDRYYHYYMGHLLLRGIGTHKNERKGIDHLNLAIQLGNSQALLLVGNYYEKIPGRFEEAIDYYTKAANEKNLHAQFKLCKYYGQEICETQGGQEIRKYRDVNKAQAYFFAMHDTIHKSPSKHAYLGFCYENGLGTSKNMDKAQSSYKRAADEGNAATQFALCKKYYEENDLEKANEYFKLLSEPNHPEVEYEIEKRYRSIALCYANGMGTDQNLDEAKRYYELAAQCGDLEAQELLNKLSL